MNLAATPPASACTLGTQGSFGPDRITRNAYDAADQLLKVTEAWGTADQADEVTYGYTPNGRKEYVTDANGNKARLAYDGHDRQSHWYFPDKASVGTVSASDYEAYGYDPDGNRTSLRNRAGETIAYTPSSRIASNMLLPVRGNPLPERSPASGAKRLAQIFSSRPWSRTQPLYRSFAPAPARGLVRGRKLRQEGAPSQLP